MKKIIIALTSLFVSTMSFAAYNFTVEAGLFSNNDGTFVTKELNYAVIADLTKGDFAGFSLESGDVLSKGSYVDSTKNYVTVHAGTLFKDPSYDETSIMTSTSLDNLNVGTPSDIIELVGGEQFAIVVWEQDIVSNTVLQGGEMYCFFTPSLVGGELSGGNDWIAPESNSGKMVLNALTSDYDPSFSVPASALTLSQTVTAVPEPSTYAVVFGALALGFVAYRRRK